MARRIRSPDGRRNHHRKPDGVPRVTQEERIAKMRAEGKPIGRPEGIREYLPRGTGKALREFFSRADVRDSLDTLAAKEHGLRSDITDPEARKASNVILDLARRATVAAVTGIGVSAKRAPAVINGARELRDEFGEPIVKKTHIDGKFDLGVAVAEAAAIIEAREASEVVVEVEEEPKKEPVVAKGPIIRKKNRE